MSGGAGRADQQGGTPGQGGDGADTHPLPAGFAQPGQPPSTARPDRAGPEHVATAPPPRRPPPATVPVGPPAAARPAAGADAPPAAAGARSALFGSRPAAGSGAVPAAAAAKGPAAATVAPSAPRAPGSGSGGDTVRLPTRAPAAAASASPAAEMPRRSAARTVVRFGFFGFLFGLIGLAVRMVVVTLLVGGLCGGLAFLAVQNYVKTGETLVPDVKGRRVDEAFEALSQKNFAMKRERVEPSVMAEGMIIDQQPPAGGTAKEGTTVRVVVSRGRAAFVVPDVKGETRDSATNKIKGARLQVGDITYDDDERAPKDTVISQSPEAGKGMDQPGKVDLLVSRGPRGSSLTMPEVTGRTLAEARTALARIGVADIAADPPDSGPEDRVTGQEPLVGKTIMQSQRITLRTNR